MNAETFERKVKQIESDKAELERKFEDMTSKYEEVPSNVSPNLPSFPQVKAELANTLASLEDL